MGHDTSGPTAAGLNPGAANDGPAISKEEHEVDLNDDTRVDAVRNN